LLKSFAGTPGIVEECVQLFRDDPSVGLIGAKEYRETGLGKNDLQFERMLDLFKIGEQNRAVEYVAGTMFLVRPEIVKRLYDRLREWNWEHGEDKDLAFHLDGQVAHAVERLIGNLVRQMGYRIAWK